MKKVFEPLQLEIYYFDEMDAITCSFPADDRETGILTTTRSLGRNN